MANSPSSSSSGSSTIVPIRNYMTQNEYVDMRNDENALITTELCAIRNSVRATNDTIELLKSDVMAQLNRVETHSHTALSAMGDVRTEMHGDRMEMFNVRSELRSDMVSLSSQLHDIQMDMVEMRSHRHDVEFDIDDLRSGIKRVDSEVTEVRSGMSDMRQEVFINIVGVSDEISQVGTQVRSGFERVDNELEELRSEMTSNFESVDRLVKKMHADIRQMHSELKDVRLSVESMDARGRNSRLKNPVLPIFPVNVFHPTKGVIAPDSQQFPRNAKAFYALRNPTSGRQRSMLAYLMEFYDLQCELDFDEDNEEDIRRTKLVVELLEGILGLNEENFVKFKAQADRKQAKDISSSSFLKYTAS